MGAGQTVFAYKHLTGTAVVAGSVVGAGSTNTGGPQAFLHIIVIGSGAAAATITVYDDNQTGSPVAGNVVSIFTVGAAAIGPTYVQFDALMARGIAVIVTGAIDFTVIYR